MPFSDSSPAWTQVVARTVSAKNEMHKNSRNRLKMSFESLSISAFVFIYLPLCISISANALVSSEETCLFHLSQNCWSSTSSKLYTILCSHRQPWNWKVVNRPFYILYLCHIHFPCLYHIQRPSKHLYHCLSIWFDSLSAHTHSFSLCKYFEGRRR